MATSEQTKAKFEKTQEASPSAMRWLPSPPGKWDVPADVYEALCKHINKGHKRFPKQSAGGNAQSKYEHWAPCSYAAGRPAASRQASAARAPASASAAARACLRPRFQARGDFPAKSSHS